MKQLRFRVALVALIATGAALFTVLLLAGPALRRRAVAHQEQALAAEARLMSYVVAEPLARGAAVEVLDPLVDRAAHAVSARVTVIGVDGRVLADSALSQAQVRAVESHARRPEVMEALAGRDAFLVRASTTVHDQLLYAAVPILDGSKVVGVSRVALSLRDVDALAAELQRSVAAAGGLAFLITAILSAVFASSLAGPLRDTMAAARRFAAGDLAARVPVRRDDELGELAAILNQALDQLQLRFSEGARDRARLEAVLAAMEDGVLAVDATGSVILANGSVQRLLGADPVGRHVVDSFRQREVTELVQAVLSGRDRRALDELPWRRSERTLHLLGVPFPGPGGDLTGALITFHDVTDRRRLERVRREFVANASHELRTPLTSIRGFVEALEDGAVSDPERGPRFLAKIRRHSDQMAALLDDLLELSALEGGVTAAQPRDVAVADVVADAIASLEDGARRRKVTVTVEDEGAPDLRTDPDRLQRLVSNLVDNAIKYGHVGGRVRVRLRLAEPAACLIEVADDGPGIEAEHLPRLFERFYRVDKARSRDQGGTGLGLSIVKHLAGSLGAQVDVESRPGSGTTFRVVVPSLPQAAGADGGQSLARTGGSATNR